MASKYDSKEDTYKHINRVRQLLSEMVGRIRERATGHDDSKLREPEKSFFDKYTPLLASLTYGSPEYMQALAELKPALDHHYQANSHHPEHYANGISDMSLFDILEMLADWKAAGERHGNGGNLARSIEINIERFQISPELAGIITKTAVELGWIEAGNERD